MSSKANMIRTRIRLTEKQYEQLKDASHKKNVSVAELIRKGIDAYMSREAMPSNSDIRRRAGQIAGKYRSGKGDLSTSHDKYLAETLK